MIITTTTMKVLFGVIKTCFMNAFASHKNEHTAWWRTEPSDTETADFPILLQSSGMREWLGDKVVKNITANMLSLKNREFEETFGIKKTKIEDNKAIQLSSIFATLGVNAANLHPDIAFEALVANEKWIDGKTFYSATRKYGKKSTIVNYTEDAFSLAAFNAGRLAMAAYRGHGGKSLKAKATRLIVGPANEAAAEAILLKETLAGGENNMNYKRVVLEVHEDLVGDYENYWFLMDDRDKVITPVIVLDRKKAEFVRMDNPADSCMFDKGEARYGTEARAVAGKTLPHRIYGGFTPAE
jgi:phage major head subunit gpT-like protein